jgi:tripartite-type tricarboxylate transporter receptor subunit TctC
VIPLPTPEEENMSKVSRRTVIVGTASLPFASAPSVVQAQAKYPSKAVKFLIPQPPGGGADLLVRTLQPKMQELLGQPIVVENKPGAAGNIGTVEGARSAADGYTLVFVNLSTMAVNPYVYANTGYKIDQFEPVTNMASVTNLICVNPEMPAKTMAEFIAMAKAKPGSINYGTAGNGSENHLMGELLKSMAGIDLQHVPYRGGGPAVIAVVGGEVQAIVADPLSIMSHIKSGKVRPLAVTSAARVKSLPDVPTIAESGVAGYEATGWRALVLPKGTPKDIIDVVHAATIGALKDPAISAKLSEQLYEPVGNSPAEFAKFIETENAKWSGLIKKIGLKLD